MGDPVCCVREGDLLDEAARLGPPEALSDGIRRRLEKFHLCWPKPVPHLLRGEDGSRFLFLDQPHDDRSDRLVLHRANLHFLFKVF